jgi:hypothetical protein
VSDALSDRRLSRQGPGRSAGQGADGLCTLNVQAVFRDLEAEHAQTLAAEMIARAHELANRPECECDVDVSVQWAPPAAPVDGC